MDQARHAGPGESFSDVDSCLQPEGPRLDPPAPGQNPAHAEGELFVRLSLHRELYSHRLSSDVTVKLLICAPVGLSHQITNLIWTRLPGPPLHLKTPWRSTALCGPW